MKGKIISIRLNIEKLTDKKADEILSSLPSRRKSEFVRNAIISYNNQRNLLELMKRALLEAMKEWDGEHAEKRNENGETKNIYVDYLKSL